MKEISLNNNSVWLTKKTWMQNSLFNLSSPGKMCKTTGQTMLGMTP